MHWTAGGHTANATDKRHYHEIVEGDGNRVVGDKLPEANISTADGHYAAHVRRMNTKSIGLSMAAMAGARERPFSSGRYPITPVQLDVFAGMVAEYADTYDIEISRETVLSHSEVPITHSIPQPGKWDLNWLPGMAAPGHPIEVGDHLRKMINDKRNELINESSTVVAGAASGDLSDQLATHIRDFLERRSA